MRGLCLAWFFCLTYTKRSRTGESYHSDTAHKATMRTGLAPPRRTEIASGVGTMTRAYACKRYITPFQPYLLELQPRGSGKIDMWLGMTERHASGKSRLGKPHCQLRIHFVAIAAYARPDPRTHFVEFGSHFLHAQSRKQRKLSQRSAPSGVDCSHCPYVGSVEKHGHTIGSPHSHIYSLAASDKRIGIGE